MKTITKQILLSLVITVLVVLGGWGYFEHTRADRLEYENLQRTHNYLVKSLSYYLISPVWTLSHAEIMNTVHAQSIEKSVQAIFVYDEEKRLYAGGFRENLTDRTFTTYDGNKLSHRQYFAAMKNPRIENIVKDGKVIGQLVISLSDHFLQASMRERKVLFALRMLGLICALLLVQFFVLRAVAIVPMKKLNEWVLSIRSTGALPTRPSSEKECDEIATLANSFSEMATYFIESKHELEEYRGHLEELVKKRTIALVNKAAQLEASIKELDSFSYSVSHDLRAPLRGIDGWSLALVEDYGDKLDERAQGYLARVRSETQRMGNLIDDILMLAKITRTEVRFKEVDLSLLAEIVAKRMCEENESRKLNIQIEPNLITTGDQNFLEIVLTNLFNNACKFTSKVEEAKIEFGQTIVNGEKTFFVRDNGAGFSMNSSMKLFGAFQRFHKQSDFPGTGVGLAIVKRIINIHSGIIWAESAVNQGATFYFSFDKKNIVSDSSFLNEDV